ncbi:MAG: SufD family Fe-S cluster assembly protein [Clostridia bacterium]|nr:SufD family Fe-S cluster assembly protein [Clostridia bacterium]
MKINMTPVRTSNNYGINEMNVPDEILNCKKCQFHGISFKNFEPKFDDVKEIPTKPISEKLLKNIENEKLVFNINGTNKNIFELKFNFDNENAYCSKTVVFNIFNNANSKIVIRYQGNAKCFNYSFLKFNLLENSNAQVVVICELDGGSSNFQNIESKLSKNAKIDIKFIDFAQDYSILNYYSKLEGECSKSEIKTLYLGKDKNKIDINIFEDIFGEKCLAEIETVGALFDEAEKNFKGTINFNKGAKKSYGNESELCLLLSKKAKSKALPMLLCTEEDVDGSHSTAVGKIGDKELFYMMSRGLTKTEALKLMIKAKFNSVLNGLFDEQLKEEILNKIDGKVNDEK